MSSEDDSTPLNKGFVSPGQDGSGGYGGGNRTYNSVEEGIDAGGSTTYLANKRDFDWGHNGLRDSLEIKSGSKMWKLLDFISVFTIFVGVNFLGLPYTVSKVGIIPAVLILCAIIIVTYHGCSLLLVCKEKIEERKLRESNESLLEIEKSLRLGYGILARDAFGPTGEAIVTISVFLIHFCFCTGYIIFLGNSLEALSEDFFHARVCSSNGLTARDLHDSSQRMRRNQFAVFEGKSGSNLTPPHLKDHGILNLTDLTFFKFGNITHDVELDCDFKPEDAPSFHSLVWLMSPFFVILCLPNVQLLRDVLNVLSFVTFIIVYLSLSGWLATEMAEDSFKPAHKLFLAEGLLFTFGQASSTLEGMGAITEVSDELHENSAHVNSYVAKTFAFALPSYLVLGILGYVVLGSDVEQVITHNLPPNEELALLVNFMVVCLILFGYPNMAYPGQKVLDRWCFQLFTSSCFDWCSKDPRTSDFDEYTVRKEKHLFVARLSKVVSRIAFVLSTIGLSTCFQQSFIYISAFTGAMDNCLLSLIFPAAIHTKVMMNELSLKTKIKNAFVMVLGVCLICVSIISFSLIKTNVALSYF